MKRNQVTTAACSLLLASTLGACGGQSEDGPTTQSVDDYASTQAQKSSKGGGAASETSAGTSEATGSGPSSASESSSGGGAPSSSDSPATSEPAEPADRAQVRTATDLVRDYLNQYNKAVRDPSVRGKLDSYRSKKCTSCEDLESIPEKLAKENKRFKGDAIRWNGSVARDADASSTIEIFVRMDQLAQVVVDKKGEKVTTTEGKPDFEKAFGVEFSDSGARIIWIKESIDDKS